VLPFGVLFFAVLICMRDGGSAGLNVGGSYRYEKQTFTHCFSTGSLITEIRWETQPAAVSLSVEEGGS
jgi:hypothetical protein